MIADLERAMVEAGLSKTEQIVFLKLAARPGAVVSKAELLSATRASAPHTIDSHIMAIRRKLAAKAPGLRVETVTGSGFVLSVSEKGGVVKPT